MHTWTLTTAHDTQTNRQAHPDKDQITDKSRLRQPVNH